MSGIIESLSKDAKVVASMFAMMKRGPDSGLMFHMRENRPTARMQAALDELVTAGVIEQDPKPLNDVGGVRYIPVADCWPYQRWAGKHIDDPDIRFPIAESIRTALTDQVTK